MPTFNEGDRVFLANGVVAAYVAETSAGHVVSVKLRREEDYDEWYEEDVRVVDRVYQEPLVEQVDEKIAERRATVERLSALIDEMRSTLKDAEAESKARRDVLGKWSGFNTLEAFMRGSITHVVIEHGYRGPKIETLSDALKGDSSVDRRNLRLVSLFGRSNGDYEWMLNHYSDGNGGWETMYPVESYDDAVEKVRELWSDRVSAWRDDTTKWHPITSWIDVMPALGIVVPDDVSVAVHEKKMKEAVGLVSSARDALEKASAKVDALEGVER